MAVCWWSRQCWQRGACSSAFPASPPTSREPNTVAHRRAPALHHCVRRQKQSARASLDPTELIENALVALRKADSDRLSGQLAPGLVQLGSAERQVLLVGGEPIIETGPLANFADVVDTGSRRLLPGNLLRRCKVLSSLHIGPDRFQQRVAVTACTGEEGVLDWSLQRQSGSWWVSSIRRDTSTDYPLPDRPHPRVSPESVILAQLATLQRGDVASAAKFHVFATVPHGADMSERAMATILQSDNFLPILGHETAKLGASALPTSRKFVQEVSVISRAGRFVGRGRFPSISEPESPIKKADAKYREMIQGSYVWTMALRDSGTWLVQTVQAVCAE